MRIFFTSAVILLALLHTSATSFSAEKESGWPGIEEAGFITATREIAAGVPFYVGFRLRPLPGYHTYWRGPGVVGVATQIQWKLPEGFHAGPILWPPPVKTDMAGITANGYKKEVILLTRITPPDTLSGDSVTLEAKAAWMACATSCHPSVDNFSLTLPITGGETPILDSRTEERFKAILNALPKSPPQDWSFSISAPRDNQLVLEGTIPKLEQDASTHLIFFSDDMQVDSNSPPRFEWIDPTKGQFRMHFVRPDFAPASPEKFSGILCHRKGWPGLSSSCIEISIPWKNRNSTDE